MQYVVSQIKHDTGEVFYNTIKPKDNEVCYIVQANTRKEAIDKVKKQPKGILSLFPSKFNYWKGKL